MKKLLLIWLTCWAWCAHGMVLDSTLSGALLTPGMQYLEDPQGQLTLVDMARPEVEARFKAPAESDKAINFGLSRSAYWLRLSVQRAPDNADEWLIELPYALLDQIAFYAPGAAPVVTGAGYPMASRPFFDKYYVFPIRLQPQAQHYYLRVVSQNAITVPLRAWTRQDFIVRMQSTLAVQFLYFGAMMALVLYTLFMFALSRDKRYGLYAVYVACLSLSMVSGSGVARMFFWPDVGAFDSIARNLFLACGASTMLFLSGLFLKVEYHRARVAWGWRLGAIYFGTYAVLLAASLFWPLPQILLNKAMLLGGGVAGLAILLVVTRVVRERRRSLRIFGLSWLVFWMGGFVGIARTMNLLPTHFLTSYAVQIASMGEMVLLFLALADQFRQEQLRHALTQREAERAQGQLLEQLKSSHERLELTVAERTQQLQESLENEKDVLAQYMRFGAMISHEFRNPLGIIRSQLGLMRKEQERGELVLAKRLNVLDSAAMRLSVLFEKWLQSDRLNQTLKDLDPHPIPLRSWLEHFVATHVHCLIGVPVQLREVAPVSQLVADEYLLDIALANLIDNARKYAGHDAPLTLEIRSRQGQVGLAVIDQGPGIADEYQKRVFDEYFRISPQAGVSGVGLGLSIVCRIMQAHDGELELQSPPGQGCTFILWFPEKRVPVL